MVKNSRGQLGLILQSNNNDFEEIEQSIVGMKINDYKVIQRDPSRECHTPPSV